MFVLCCFTGLAYEDVQTLKPEAIRILLKTIIMEIKIIESEK